MEEKVIEPVGNMVLVEPFKESGQTDSGLLIPGKGKHLKCGKVLKKGPNVHGVDVGDKIHFNIGSRTLVKGTDHVLLRVNGVNVVESKQ